MILIDALFINKGGGAVLLKYLIEKILSHPQRSQFFFLLDPRFEKPAALDENFVVINNNMIARTKFPVKLTVPVYTYFHNQKLLESSKQKFKRQYFKPYLKYLFVKRYNANTVYYIVQTPHMAEAITRLGLKDYSHCLTIPFYDDRKYVVPHSPFSERVKDEFVFIANPSPQKNYPKLLDAWEYLLEKGSIPKLHVTIDDTAPQLLARITSLNSRGARIANHQSPDIAELYVKCPYLIFPSVMESFGLPLIEAVDSGMKVLASSLPYVLDVITPSLTFDPYDKISISDAVIKALRDDLPFPKIRTVNEVDRLVELLTGGATLF